MPETFEQVYAEYLLVAGRIKENDPQTWQRFMELGVTSPEALAMMLTRYHHPDLRPASAAAGE